MPRMKGRLPLGVRKKRRSESEARKGERRPPRPKTLSKKLRPISQSSLDSLNHSFSRLKTDVQANISKQVKIASTPYT